MTNLISISEAAQQLEMKPMQVQRLIDAGNLRSAVLVDADHVAEIKATA